MLHNIRRSLADLLARAYLDGVIASRSALTGEDPAVLRAIAEEKADFYPEAFAARQESLMSPSGGNPCTCFPGYRKRCAHGFLPGRPAQLGGPSQRAGGLPHRRRREDCTLPPRASIITSRWDIPSQATPCWKMPKSWGSPTPPITIRAALSPARWNGGSSPRPTG